MITEYFNCNLNLITMFPKCILVKEETRSRNRKIKENYLKDSNLNGFVPANELMKEFRIGALKLKRLFLTIGVEPKYNRSITYYPENRLQQIKDILAEPKQIPVIDKTGYINTQELMTMFNYTENKTFNIIHNNKIIKQSFGGRINYYEKESTISIFMKYKKN